MSQEINSNNAVNGIQGRHGDDSLFNGAFLGGALGGAAMIHKIGFDDYDNEVLERNHAKRRMGEARDKYSDANVKRLANHSAFKDGIRGKSKLNNDVLKKKAGEYEKQYRKRADQRINNIGSRAERAIYDDTQSKAYKTMYANNPDGNWFSKNKRIGTPVASVLGGIALGMGIDAMME